MKVDHESIARSMADCTTEVTWVLNLTQNRYTYVSPSVLRQLSYTVKEALVRSIEDTVTPESVQLVYDQISDELGQFLKDPDSTQVFVTEQQLLRKDRTPGWFQTSRKYRYNKANEIEIVGIDRCIEEQKRKDMEVEFLSFHDQLTGLFNRRFFEEEAKRLDTRRNLPISMVMADVNALSQINSAAGMTAGNELLCQFADILRQHCRSDDIIARIGGDEFAILLPKTDNTTARDLICRILHELNLIPDNPLSVTFGWKTKTHQSEALEKVFLDAEEDLYLRKIFEGRKSRPDTMKNMINGLFQRDTKERLHSVRVSQICRNIGTALGLDQKTIDDVVLAGLYHDVGKIALDEELLHKSGKLDQYEIEALHRHPEIGYRILKSVADLVGVAEYVKFHHERPDGQGYPDGKKGDEIPLQSRIIGVAEAYDLMTRSYQYKDAMPQRDAILELEKNAGTQFDERVVRVFVEQILARLPGKMH